MKITTIDKGTAEAITSRLHDAVRDVADSMGVTVYVERTKFSTVEMSVTFSIKLPADKTEFPHYVYDGFADREGVEYGEHFVDSRYRVKVDKSYQIVTVTGVDFKARKYKVCVENRQEQVPYRTGGAEGQYAERPPYVGRLRAVVPVRRGR